MFLSFYECQFFCMSILFTSYSLLMEIEQEYASTSRFCVNNVNDSITTYMLGNNMIHCVFSIHKIIIKKKWTIKISKDRHEQKPFKKTLKKKQNKKHLLHRI